MRISSPVTVKMIQWKDKQIMSDMETLKKQLKALITGKTALVGMGNILKADDGAGPLLISRLRQNLTGRPEVLLFDTGVTPENYLGPLTKASPATVLVIDAADFGCEPGEVHPVTQTEFAAAGFSTHTINPGFFINYLRENGIRNIIFLGIQPGDISLGGQISPAVEKTLDSLAELFLDIL